MFPQIRREPKQPTYWELKRQIDRAAREAMRPRASKRDCNRYFALLKRLERGEYRDNTCGASYGRGY